MRHVRIVVVCSVVMLLALSGLPAAAETGALPADKLPPAIGRPADQSNAQRQSPPPPLQPDEEARDFADFGCWDDPIGDTFDRNFDPAFSPNADLIGHCLDYGRALLLLAAVQQPTAVEQDPVWQERDAFAQWNLDANGDDVADFIVIYQVFEGEFIWTVFDAVAPFGERCEGPAIQTDDGQYIAGPIPPSCLDFAVQLAVETFFAYNGVSDVAPNVEPFEEPVLRDFAEFQCPPSNDDLDADVVVLRISCGGGRTNAIDQAVAVSELLILDDGAAASVVLSRDDNFPDALAGSALTVSGATPLLFTYSPQSAAAAGVPSGRLAPATRRELLRVLDPGGLVYLLGGGSAIDLEVDEELRSLGYAPRRFAGGERTETAALVSAEVRRLIEDLSRTGFPDLRSVVIATAANWPDAVSSGQVASFWGMPVLLTNRDTLPLATIQALQRIRPEYIYVVGGEAVISRAIRDEIRQYATGSATRVSHCQGSSSCRVFGRTRTETSEAVARLNRFLFDQNQSNEFVAPDAGYAIAVNLWRQPDGFAHVLSAATLTGAFAGVFVAPSDLAGSQLDTVGRFFVCERLRGLNVFVLGGGPDLIADALGDTIRRLVRDGCG